MPREAREQMLLEAAVIAKRKVEPEKPYCKYAPLAGPQTMAYESGAFETLFGGSAGPGKSTLLLILARMKHRKSLLLRRTYPELEDTLILKSKEIYGSPDFYNASKHVWNFEDGCRIRFGHLEHEKNVFSYQSAEFDLIGFDELTQFSKQQYTYLLSRARSTDKGQRIRILSCTNPGGEGNDWVMERWAAWLDDTYPKPAQPGELRYFKRLPNGNEVETTVSDKDGMSRTFIPAKLIDNPYLGDEYRRTLNLLPEPYRSQLLHGDWKAGNVDDAYQVIPREWVKAAMARWRQMPTPDGKLSGIGIDVSRGGQDQTVIARRRGNWFAPLDKYPGSMIVDGQSVVSLLVDTPNDVEINIDVIGVGASAYDLAKEKFLAVPINWANRSEAKDKSGKFGFINKRAEHWWKLRELLDPEGGKNIALPDDPELFGDLCAPRYRVQSNGIRIESKEEIKDRIGRSPDCGDAVVLSAIYKAPAGGATSQTPVKPVGAMSGLAQRQAIFGKKR